VSGESSGRLVDLADLLAGVAVERGFIAPGDADRLLERHVLDGVRATPFLTAGDSVADVGSGAGIPGVPLAIVLPDVRFELIEPRQARVAFVESTVDRLGLTNVSVVHGRVEAVGDASYDAALARAFAPVDRAWATIRPKLRAGGRLVFYAGERAELPPELPGAAAIDRHDADPETAAVLERNGPLIIITAQ
jgi:16S rRNA (guanine527-N7)-methyltransferase